MYRWNSIVKFKCNDEIKEGIIKIVDENGTFGQSEEPSYDIECDGTLWKHIPQSEITEFVCMAFERMTDAELYATFMAIKGVINECGMHEKSMKEYMQISTEIALRYFDEKGLYDRKARDELMKQILDQTKK